MFYDADIVIVVLALFTLAAVIFFALSSKAAAETRRRDPDAPKSTLATDAPNHDTPHAGPQAERARGYD